MYRSLYEAESVWGGMAGAAGEGTFGERVGERFERIMAGISAGIARELGAYTIADLLK